MKRTDKLVGVTAPGPVIVCASFDITDEVFVKEFWKEAHLAFFEVEGELQVSCVVETAHLGRTYGCRWYVSEVLKGKDGFGNRLEAMCLVGFDAKKYQDLVKRAVETWDEMMMRLVSELYTDDYGTLELHVVKNQDMYKAAKRLEKCGLVEIVGGLGGVGWVAVRCRDYRKEVTKSSRQAKVDAVLRERVIPFYGPGQGDTYKVWVECVKVLVPDATDVEVGVAMCDAFRDGLLFWNGSEYARPGAVSGRDPRPRCKGCEEPLGEMHKRSCELPSVQRAFDNRSVGMRVMEVDTEGVFDGPRRVIVDYAERRVVKQLSEPGCVPLPTGREESGAVDKGGSLFVLLRREIGRIMLDESCISSQTALEMADNVQALSFQAVGEGLSVADRKQKLIEAAAKALLAVKKFDEEASCE